LRNKA